MPRTPVRKVGQESASLQALVLWCSSCKGLMGGMVMRPGEANYYRYYKRLGAFAKFATSYFDDRRIGADLLGSALGDLHPKVQHRHPLRNVHDHAHVMFDEDNGLVQLFVDVEDKA